MRRLVLLAALVLLVGGSPATTRAASSCALDLEQRNSWHGLGALGAVAMDDAHPCRMLAVSPDGSTRRSDDGGATWQSVGTAPSPAASLVTAGLESRVFLLGKQGGAWLTEDRGRSWHAVAGLTGEVADVVPGFADVLYAVVRSTQPAAITLPVTATGGLYVSDDAGNSFHPVSGVGTANLAISSVAADAAAPDWLWLGVPGQAGGLFLSTDNGQTATRVAAGDVQALATAALAGGGGEVIAATSDGVLVSRDGGNSVSHNLSGTAFRDVAIEWDHPTALMLVADNVRRSADTALHESGESDGLPPGCGPQDLRRDRSVPSTFLVTCGDGTTWRYRSDGTDLTDVDRPDGVVPPPVRPVGPPPPTAMRELGRHRLPVPGTKADGSIAFDGEVLYYADMNREAIHRMVARTGAALPDLETTLERGVAQLAFDANRNHLLVLDRAFVVWDVELLHGKAVRLFHAPLTGMSQEDDERNSSRPFFGGMTYDSATDRILFAGDGSDSFSEYDRDGRERHNCASLGLPGVVTLNGNPAFEASIAGLVATGDGLVYVEAEDDSTVIRIDRSCHLLATFTHERFSEAPNENDALACDTVTFDTPAVWMRDATKAVVVAYSVDSGYCALPSTISVSAPPGVAVGQSGIVCARLLSQAKHEPLSGLPVDLLVAERGIGSPVTDGTGRACTRYVPLAREAGATGTRQPVVAAFLGTAAYRPSTARATTIVTRTVALPAPPPAPQLPVAAAVVAVPPAPPPVQPPPPPPNVPQTQPITQVQAHPGAQPGAMGALGAAPAPEDEEEAAAQAGDVHRMTGLGEPVPWPAYALPLASGLLMGAIAVRRRRASQVRPQF